MLAITLGSVLTCPCCGFAKAEAMPTDACQFYYECESCKVLLRPKPGDCCVFCSYGSVKCPPIQQSSSCHGAGPLGDCWCRTQHASGRTASGALLTSFVEPSIH
jgi:hypothetical protein